VECWEWLRSSWRVQRMGALPCKYNLAVLAYDAGRRATELPDCWRFYGWVLVFCGLLSPVWILWQAYK